jgi:hypothetical protein
VFKADLHLALFTAQSMPSEMRPETVKGNITKIDLVPKWISAVVVFD